MEPYLQFYTSQTSEVGFIFSVTNTGLGPAAVGSHELRFDGELLEDWGRLVPKLVRNDGSVDILHADFISGMRLPAESTLQLLIIPPGNDLVEQFGRAYQTSELVEHSTCYCSIYGACWEAGNRIGFHQPVRSCD